MWAAMTGIPASLIFLYCCSAALASRGSRMIRSGRSLMAWSMYWFWVFRSQLGMVIFSSIP